VKKSFILSIFLLLLIINTTNAESPTAQFLLVGQGARETAIGYAAVASCFNYSAPFWNPAASSFLKNAEVGFNLSQFPGEVASGYAAFVYPLKKFAFGGRIITESTKVTAYDANGTRTGSDLEVSNSNFSLNLSYKLFDSLSIGASLGSLTMNLADRKANAGNVSLGSIFIKNRIVLGFTVANLGGSLKFSDITEKQPQLYRIGLAYRFLEKKNLLAAISVENVPDDKNAGVRGLGIEYSLNQYLALRLGQKNVEDGTPSITAGVGISYNNLKLDYSVNQSGKELPDINVHRVGLSYKFGTLEGTPARTVTVISKPQRQPGEIINIAVADFAGKNVSQADASIVADFLRTELVNTGVYNVIEKANMEKILAEAAFQQSGCTTSECAVQIGKLLNVKQMIVGNLSKLMDTYYITANLVEVETSKIIASFDQEAMSAKELKTACKVLARKFAQ